MFVFAFNTSRGIENSRANIDNHCRIRLVIVKVHGENIIKSFRQYERVLETVIFIDRREVRLT